MGPRIIALLIDAAVCACGFTCVMVFAFAVRCYL